MEKETKEKLPREIELTNQCCFFLIKVMNETNAKVMTIKQEGVRVEGRIIGDYEIQVKRI